MTNCFLQVLGCLLGLICILLTAGYALLTYLYQVVDSGELLLPNAHGSSAIVRETETGIAHIRGATWESAVYA